MAREEAQISIQGPTGSKHSASRTVPRYMVRRAAMPGPMTGFPFTLSLGPKTVTAITAGQFTFQIPGAVRVLALGWYCASTGGASSFRVARSSTLGGALGSTSGWTGLSTSPIDLVATPSGVLYVDHTVTVAPSSSATITGLLRDFASRFFVSGADSGIFTGPEMPPTGSTTPRTFVEMRFDTASTVADFCVWVLLMPTQHSNTITASD